MVFENITFIKPNRTLKKEFSYSNFAPRFRKKVFLDNTENAKLYVCGLGYGYYYINGALATEDKFTAPVSDYQKTLWYNVYDVSHLLKKGENTFAVWCGNGWYNEDMPSSWDFDKAAWRDVPKFIMRLDVGGKTVLKSDNTWLCSPEGPIKFNALRSGEFFDARLFDETWTESDFDDSAWEQAVSDTQKLGTFRECLCEPIRECEVFKGKPIAKTGEEKYLFDIGQNISGYIRLKIKGEEGQTLTIKYAEQIKDDFSLELNDMARHYPKTEFQTDKFICSGKEITWSPRFCYHGFQFIEIDGLKSADEAEVYGVFVHQDVKLRTEFECSDEFLNKLWHAGVYSVYSNMFYALTDCPTREKLGWTNDAQSSAEQILCNFESERFFRKWLQDIHDTVHDDGEMPGIIPTAGWGYHWGNGPVSDGVLFEIPYRLYWHTGNAEPLVSSYPYFVKYFDYLKTRTDKDGFIRFGLDDWARPQFETPEDVNLVPVELINALLVMNFHNIAAIAAQLSGADATEHKTAAEGLKNLVKETYIAKDGTCKSDRQTSVAMLIYYGVYDDVSPLKEQLLRLIAEKDYHHDCGMVGMRRLFHALTMIGESETAYKILTSSGIPSYREWIEQGATTLWEYWPHYKHIDSKNHHMYSDFMSWILKNILGINFIGEGKSRTEISPFFPKGLDFVRGSTNTRFGKIAVEWERVKGEINLKISVPDGTEVYYKAQKLSVGESTFNIKE